MAVFDPPTFMGLYAGLFWFIEGLLAPDIYEPVRTPKTPEVYLASAPIDLGLDNADAALLGANRGLLGVLFISNFILMYLLD